MDLMVENGFRVIHLPKPNFAVVSSFPFKCTLSIFLAIYKVYPKLKEYIASKGLCAYPAVEVYTDDTIWVSSKINIVLLRFDRGLESLSAG